MSNQIMTAQQKAALTLSTAITLANEKGLFQVTLSEVAEQMPIRTNERSIRVYFSRRSLWKAIISDPRATQEVRDDALAAGMV